MLAKATRKIEGVTIRCCFHEWIDEDRRGCLCYGMLIDEHTVFTSGV